MKLPHRLRHRATTASSMPIRQGDRVFRRPRLRISKSPLSRTDMFGTSWAFGARWLADRLRNVSAMFSRSEPGAWYDRLTPHAVSGLRRGLHPVTAVEQPVGRILDKSGAVITRRKRRLRNGLCCVAAGESGTNDGFDLAMGVACVGARSRLRIRPHVCRQNRTDTPPPSNRYLPWATGFAYGGASVYGC